MAITDGLYRLSFGGTMFSVEEWSMSVVVGGPDVQEQGPEDFVDLITAFIQTPGTRWNAAAKLGWVKFNKLNNATGNYLNPNDPQEHIIAPETTFGGQTGPGQLAICATFGTVAARGRGSKGRIFIPMGLGGANEAGGINGIDGRWTEADALACASSVAAFLSAINLFGTQKVRVYSKLGQTDLPVTHVRVGRVIDTQRRRRSSMSEDYQNATVDQ